MSTTSSTLTSCDNFLRIKTIADLVNSRDALAEGHPDIADVSFSASIEEALDILLASHVHALPVYIKNCKRPSPETETPEDKEHFKKKSYVNLISIFDIVDYVTKQNLFEGFQDAQELSAEQQRSQTEFLNRPVSAVLENSGPDSRLKTFLFRDTIESAVRLFLDTGLHRAMVFDAPDGEVRIFSRRDIARYLLQNNDSLEQSILDQPAINLCGKLLLSPDPSTTCPRFKALTEESDQNPSTDYHQFTSNPYTIPMQTNALGGFCQIASKGVESVGIVDDDNALVAELSDTDLRGLTPKRAPELLKPVLMYLLSVHGAILKPYMIRRDFTVLQCLAGLVLTEADHAWVTDENDHPIGLITVGDALSAFCPVPSLKQGSEV